MAFLSVSLWLRKQLLTFVHSINIDPYHRPEIRITEIASVCSGCKNIFLHGSYSYKEDREGKPWCKDCCKSCICGNDRVTTDLEACQLCDRTGCDSCLPLDQMGVCNFCRSPQRRHSF